MNQNKLKKFQDNELLFSCPICREKLYLHKQSLLCIHKHCYDISKYGYVNLLLNNKIQNEYTKKTFINRRYILEQGFYQIIVDEIISFIQNTTSIHKIIDVGCGEGFYAKQIHHATSKIMYGTDIAKDSIQLATKSDTANHIAWFISDLANIPIQDNCIDCILNIFSPANYKEFQRILAPGGYIIKVIPTKSHLKELREQIPYKEYSNTQVIQIFKKSFRCISSKKVTKTFQITRKEKNAFLEMTPLLFHIDKRSVNLENITQLTIEAEVLIGTR